MKSKTTKPGRIYPATNLAPHISRDTGRDPRLTVRKKHFLYKKEGQTKSRMGWWHTPYGKQTETSKRLRSASFTIAQTGEQDNIKNKIIESVNIQ